MMMELIELCRLDDIPEKDARGFDPANENRDTVFVVKKKGQLYAYRDICPHYGDTTLPWRKDAYLDHSGTVIICAAHGAQFDIETGECFSGPCFGQFLMKLPVTVSCDGAVLVDLEPD